MPGSVIETLGDLVDNHHGVGAWCPNCEGFRPLDIHKLIARLGRDWRYVWSAMARCVRRLRQQVADHDPRRSARTGGAGSKPVRRDASERISLWTSGFAKLKWRDHRLGRGGQKERPTDRLCNRARTDRTTWSFRWAP
jgi:hypothetical protein